jgi:hypothetical protein
MENKDKYITRQSSITRAIEFYSLLGLKPTMLELVATADHFYQFVEQGVNKDIIQKSKRVDEFITAKQEK